MTVNTNPITGIAYGYIQANNVNAEVLNDIFCNGIDYSRLDADLDFARGLGFRAPVQNDGENYFDYLERVQSDMLDYFNDLMDKNPDVSETIDIHDRELEEFTGYQHVANIDDTTVIYNTDSNTICVMDSKVTGMYYKCSPCCPNAGDLDSAGGDVLTYDVPADWRELDC